MVEQPLQPLRRRLTVQDARAVGGPIALPLLAAYFGVALLGWLAAAVAQRRCSGSAIARRRV